MNSYIDLAKKIESSNCILLTTHKNCDADGFGSELALYYALTKMGKSAHVIHYEAVHPRYEFLNKDKVVKVFDDKIKTLKPDLILAFDTNDHRLVDPLYQTFHQSCPFIFLDHHQVLNSGPQPTLGSIVDVSSASTGEMAYRLIKALNIPLDPDIASALYTSIAFDTHVFKFIRNSKQSYQIASELLEYEIDSTFIHRMLFANGSIEKLKFMAHILNKIEFRNNNQSALCFITAQDMKDHNAGIEETHDILDQIMSIGECRLAILVREEQKDIYRLSFRSKNNVKVLAIAEKFNGGGHINASGATAHTALDTLRQKLTAESDLLIQQSQ